MAPCGPAERVPSPAVADGVREEPAVRPAGDERWPAGPGPDATAVPGVTTHFRRDVEGLRAVAVAVVVAYHAGVPWLAGGYVGVDAFFVVSGFLITRLLLAEHAREGRIRLARFSSRRIRRLLPASFVVLAATVVASWLVLAPLRLTDVLADARAAALYVVNIRFAVEGSDYLAAEVGESPLLHYWSLAVEEQFYLVWPAIVWGLASLARRVGRWVVPVGVAVVAAASLGLALRLTETSQPWAFFGLPSRAWEFAVGGLVALAAARAGERWAGARAALAWAGLGGLLLAVATYGAATAFPAPGALLPVLGTAAVLGATGSGAGPVGVLGLRPLQWLGARSYSVYLWHWPPLVLVPVAIDRPLRPAETALVVLAAVGVATVAHAVVEEPLRRSTWLGWRPRRGLALGAGLTLAALLVPVAIGSQVTLQSAGPEVAAPEQPAAVDASIVDDLATTGPVPSNLTPSLSSARADVPRIYAEGCHGDFAAVAPAGCRVGDVDADRTVALVGDSHAAQWFPAVEAFALDQGWALEPITKSSCPFVDATVWIDALRRPYAECDQWRAAVLDDLAQDPPELVVVASYPLYQLAGGDGPADDEAAWGAALQRSLEDLTALGSRVVLVGALPTPGIDVAACVSGDLDDATACAAPRADLVHPERAATEQAAAAAAGAGLIDPTALVCGATTCPAVSGNLLVWRDESHVTATYAAFLGPTFAAALDAALA